MYGFKICQLVIVCVHAHTEEETSVSSVNNLVIPELQELSVKIPVHKALQLDLDKVWLIFLVSWSY